MSKSIEEQIRDRLARLSGKPFQQLVWDILICHYPSLQTPRMLHDLGSDGHDFTEKTFFSVYAPETSNYDAKLTAKKISNPTPSKSEDLGDYEKFVKNWKAKFAFEKWIFVTKDNLIGSSEQVIASLNSNSDCVKK